MFSSLKELMCKIYTVIYVRHLVIFNEMVLKIISSSIGMDVQFEIEAKHCNFTSKWLMNEVLVYVHTRQTTQRRSFKIMTKNPKRVLEPGWPNYSQIWYPLSNDNSQSLTR